MSVNPFFILGVQGSGTNLTARILESVFDFAGVLDGSLIFKAALEVHRDPSRNNIVNRFWYVHRRLFPGVFRRRSTVRHFHHRNNGFVGIENSFNPDLIRNGTDFASFFYSYHAYSRGRTNIFVKSDDLWEDINLLEALFPERRCVLLVRDPRDNALSVARKNFGPRDLYIAAKFVGRQLDLYCREARRTPSRSAMVKYESLLNDPLSFVDDFSTRFGMQIPVDVEARIAQLNIRKENFNKWRKLSARDISACEWVLARHLQDLDYSFSGEPLRPLSRAEIYQRHLNDVVQRVPQKLGRSFQSLIGK